MIIERLLIGFFIATVAAMFAQVGSAMISSRPDAPAPVVVREADAPTLLKRLDTLDTRLRDAQARIDVVLANLANAREETERDATRVRLDVLYRLEDGLAHDIAKARGELAALAVR